jgi:hypothetical protein
MWCVPKLDAEYVARMEDVLRSYSAPLKKDEPLVCLDERPVQLLDHKRLPMAAQPGRIARADYEYKRMGTANVFAIVAPKLGIHLTHATADRASGNYVKALQQIARRFPRATRIHLVQDNLSSHSENCCVQTLGPKAGRRLWGRFKVHFTPKHGSWLNMAETEISLWGRECLGGRRLPTLAKLETETTAWNHRVNELRRTITWKFNLNAARKKFKLPGR